MLREEQLFRRIHRFLVWRLLYLRRCVLRTPKSACAGQGLRLLPRRKPLLKDPHLLAAPDPLSQAPRFCQQARGGRASTQKHQTAQPHLEKTAAQQRSQGQDAAPAVTEQMRSCQAEFGGQLRHNVAEVRHTIIGAVRMRFGRRVTGAAAWKIEEDRPSAAQQGHKRVQVAAGEAWAAADAQHRSEIGCSAVQRVSYLKRYSMTALSLHGLHFVAFWRPRFVLLQDVSTCGRIFDLRLIISLQRLRA
eukprot:scaffold2893_cov254-Pinguiococcus_pyrenoidosus.AAC.14